MYLCPISFIPSVFLTAITCLFVFVHQGIKLLDASFSSFLSSSSFILVLSPSFLFQSCVFSFIFVYSDLLEFFYPHIFQTIFSIFKHFHIIIPASCRFLSFKHYFSFFSSFFHILNSFSSLSFDLPLPLPLSIPPLLLLLLPTSPSVTN